MNRRLGKAKRHPTNSGIQIRRSLPISQGRFLPGGGKETRFLKETGFLVVGWVKRSDTQQIRVYKLGDRSPFLRVGFSLGG
ncbi:hypothetical protein AB3M80_05630 [Arthrospira platensis BEA 1257B]